MPPGNRRQVLGVTDSMGMGFMLRVIIAVAVLKQDRLSSSAALFLIGVVAIYHGACINPARRRQHANELGLGMKLGALLTAGLLVAAHTLAPAELGDTGAAGLRGTRF